MTDGRHFENRYIAISQRKIIRFRWNFVHSNRFWTGWTSWSNMKNLHWTDSEFDRTYFLLPLNSKGLSRYLICQRFVTKQCSFTYLPTMHYIMLSYPYPSSKSCIRENCNHYSPTLPIHSTHCVICTLCSKNNPLLFSCITLRKSNQSEWEFQAK